jgi:integrase
VQQVRLSQAAREYAKHCEAKGLAEGTIRSRLSSLAVLQAVIGDMHVSRITGQMVDDMFSHYAWSRGTRNNRVSHLRAFFGWCRSRRYAPTDSDPMFGYRMRPVPEVQRTRIPRAEWSRVVDACISPHERVIVATGLYLFLRASEQQAIQIQHIHLDDCEIDIYRQKTRQWDTMPIPLELDPFIREQMTWLSSQFTLEPHHFLIPGRFRDLHREANGRLIKGTGSLNPDKPLTHVHRSVQRILQRAGYPTAGEGEHTLRRSGARAYFDMLASSGYDGALRRVQAMLGHRSSGMTEVYLGLDIDRRKRNTELRGKPMFPVAQTTNVVSIREAAHG